LGVMERIASPIQKSWTTECICGAAWRFYEEDMQALPDERVYIVCAACEHRIEVTHLLRYAIRNKLAVAAIRALRKIKESTDG